MVKSYILAKYIKTKDVVKALMICLLSHVSVGKLLMFLFLNLHSVT